MTSPRPREPHSPRQSASPADVLQESERARFYSALDGSQAPSCRGGVSLIQRRFQLCGLIRCGSRRSEFERIKDLAPRAGHCRADPAIHAPAPCARSLGMDQRVEPGGDASLALGSAPRQVVVECTKARGKPIVLPYPSIGDLFKGRDEFMQRLHETLRKRAEREQSRHCSKISPC